MYIIKPPFLLQDFPCEMQSYPAIWKIDRSTSSDNQVSCRQITLNLKLILLSSSIYVLSHVKTNNKSPTKYFELDSASCRAAKELSVDTNRASLRQLLAAQ